MHTRHKHTTSAWRNKHTSNTRAPTTPRVTIQTENTTSITPLTQTYNILQHSKAKNNTFLNNGRYTINIPTDPHTITTNDIKTNTRHIHILSLGIQSQEAITKYCAHLHHTLAALKRYCTASPVAPLINSNHIYTKFTICGHTPPEWLHCWPDGQEKLAGGPQAWRSDSPPPLAKVMWVGRPTVCFMIS